MCISIAGQVSVFFAIRLLIAILSAYRIAKKGQKRDLSDAISDFPSASREEKQEFIDVAEDVFDMSHLSQV